MSVVREHNTETGEIIERPMTAEELESWQKLQQRAILDAQAKVDAEAKKAAAEAKLETLGLTTDDLKALGLGGN